MLECSSQCQVNALKEGMVLGESIFDADGKLLLFEGAVLKAAYIEKIRSVGLTEVKILSTSNRINVHIEAESPNIELDEETLIIEMTKKDALALVEDIMERVAVNSKIDTEKLYVVISQIIDEILSRPEVTLNLASLRQIDDYIFQHSVNVCILSIITGVFMGFNKVRLVNLGIGSLLHDVGKMKVNHQVLNKPEKLLHDEFNEIKCHALHGFNVLREIRDISLESKFVVLQHHECFDGSGYPQGLAGDDIHVFAKIVSLADVFDAITSDRIYCQKEDPYTASRFLIEEMGVKFDPLIVKIFLKVIGYYPVGLNVELNNGEYGVIVRKNRDKPVVKILFDEHLNRVNFYYEVDLAKNPKVAIIDVDPQKLRISCLDAEQSV